MSVVPEALEKTIQHAKDVALAGDLKGSEGILNNLLHQGIAASTIAENMRKLDPGREVWESPIGVSDTGVRALPLIEGRYAIYSDIYGHSVDVPYDEPAYDEAFISTCETLYDKAVLHGRGRVAIDTATSKLGFLIAELFDDEPITEEDVQEVGSRHGVAACLMAQAHLPLTSGGEPGKPLMTAFVTDIDQLKSVPDIASDLCDLLSPYHPDWKI
jgi:hypothetical protein